MLVVLPLRILPVPGGEGFLVASHFNEGFLSSPRIYNLASAFLVYLGPYFSAAPLQYGEPSSC